MKSSLTDAVRKYFAEQGYMEIEPPEGVDVAFRKGEHRVGVKLVKFSRSSVRDRRAIRSELYKMLRDKPCEELYIAVEEISFGRLPLPYEFRESGIGLLKVSGASVEVVIPATPFRREFVAPARDIFREDRFPRVEGEYVSVDQLVKVVKELRELLEEVRRYSGVHAESFGKLSDGKLPHSVNKEAAQSEVKENERNLEYPLAVDFIKDNPWLGIIGGFGVKKEGN